MNPFSLGNAWSKGISFFSGQAAGHAIILIGVGILVPLVLQFVLLGGPMAMNPAMMAGDPSTLMALGTTMLLLSVVNYLLQMGSYFGSWRLGFGAGENVGGALVYGLVAALVFMGCFLVLIILMAVIAGGAAQGGGGAMLILMLLFLIPLMILFAMLFTVIMAFVCVLLLIALLLVLAFGAGSLGQYNASLEMLGGGAIVVLISLIIAALLFWITARFSCVTSYMAHRKTYNLFEAMGASWRMTAANQWRILGYLALLGIVLLVVFFLVGMIAGASMMGSMAGGGMPEVGIGTVIVGLIVSIPLAYLLVLVPAGIYRELGGGADSAQVFA